VNGARRLAAAGCLLGLLAVHASGQAAPIVWTLDDPATVGGNRAERLGSPRAVTIDGIRGIEFDGTRDGLLLDANPIAGLERFTIEVTLRPGAGGPEEQRFLHIQETGSEDRALLELRMGPDGRWSLDTYLRDGDRQLTLLDRGRLHDADRWHVVALVYDGRSMRHYVDGVFDGEGEVRFTPLGSGRTSIGVRQNRISWFKGTIGEVRVTPEALPIERLKRIGGAEADNSDGRPRAIPLWPDGVPGAQTEGGTEREEDGRVYNVQTPTLTYYPAAGWAAVPTAVIVCPGGSYARLAMANEAAGAVRALQPLGASVFVLKYRLSEYGYPAPLQDIVRAVRIVRSRAAEFGVRPDRIGIFGASAGGHLAAAAATLFDAEEARGVAAIDRISARPDFVALLYPVITMQGPFTHADSRRNLLGAAPADALLDRMSIETRVRKDMPPVFLVHTAEDTSVPIENSLRFVEALRHAGVPVEAHFYERGKHGFGMATDLGTTSEWVARWTEWMRAHGWL
jgi:acetyl esterase/lipase